MAVKPWAEPAATPSAEAEGADMRARALTCVLLASLGAACEDGYKPPSYSFGAVAYACAGDTDPMCDGLAPRPRPDIQGYSMLPPVARSSVFSIQGGVHSLTPARLIPDGSALTAARVGLGAVADGFSYDHVNVVEPAEIEIGHESSDRSGTFDEIFGGTDFPFRFPKDRFRAILLDAQGQRLAGASEYGWTSDNPAVIEVLSGGTHIVEFEIVGEGMATLRVEAAGVAAEIPFNISFN